jgi:hypothetical protein
VISAGFSLLRGRERGGSAEGDNQREGRGKLERRPGLDSYDMIADAACALQLPSQRRSCPLLLHMW